MPPPEEPVSRPPGWALSSEYDQEERRQLVHPAVDPSSEAGGSSTSVWRRALWKLAVDFLVVIQGAQALAAGRRDADRR